MNCQVVFPIFVEPSYRLTRLITDGKYTQTFFGVDEGEFPFIPCIVQKISLQQQALSHIEAKVRVLRQLEKYPHIPKLLSYICTTEFCYLVFEYIEGASLDKLFLQHAIHENEIWQLLTDVLCTLKLLHNHHLIHCDIKPENIVLCRDGESNTFVLVDFAAAQIAGAVNIPNNNIIVGSPEYVAPEQLQGKPTFSSDLYSLGVTCIHLLTQIPPFDLFDIANNQWVWRHYLQSPISTRLSYILDKLINQDINLRFQSVDEVIKAIGMSPLTFTTGFKDSLKNNIQQLQAPVEGLRNNQIFTTSHTLILNSYHESEVNSVDIHPSNNIIASAHNNKTVYIWDLTTRQVVHLLSGHLQPVKSVVFSPDGKLLATASDDKTIKLWNLDTYQEVHTLIGHKHAVKSVAFSPDGKIIASGSWDKTVRLWNVATGKEISVPLTHKLQVSAVTFSSDGSLLASSSFDKKTYLWKFTQPDNNQYNLTLHSTLSGHTWAVTSVAFSPDGKILATGSDDNTIKLWDVNSGGEMITLSGHSWSITALAFNSTGEILISASKDKTIKLWQVGERDDKEIMTLSGHTDSVTSIAIANTNVFIVSCGADKTIKIWE